MISLRVHNILDYVMGGVLAVSPWLFGFSELLAARNAFLILGLALIGYSLLTNYTYSILKVIPVGAHMAMDVLLGVILMLAPSLWGYRIDLTGWQYALHFIFGLGAIGLVALTSTAGKRPPSIRLSEESKPVDFQKAA